MIEKRTEPRKPTEATPLVKDCPWCRGRLELQPRFPLRMMIPGDSRAAAEHDVPESLRTIRAWVCSTPLCKYRETAY